MAKVDFDTAEYQADGAFKHVHYQFEGEQARGWKIFRDGQPHLSLGPGYELLHGQFCGVCATDLARRHLPFPLPQIIGHEVVALQSSRRVVVDINASHQTLGHDVARCPFCRVGLGNHCPDRLTLGIDRLPGGFSPWLLAPNKGLFDVPAHVSSPLATLVEPLAAALQSLACSPPSAGDRVAVLGPKRLGMLQLAALASFRDRDSVPFEIGAVARHASLLALAAELGADFGIHNGVMGEPHAWFDIVYDTTGHPNGFLAALKMARRAVHLKSTHGLPVAGLDHISDLVVDEQALLGFRPEHLDFAWAGERRDNRHILVLGPVPEQSIPTGRWVFHRLSLAEACDRITMPEFFEGSPLPRFDLVIAGSLADVDAVLRPGPGRTSPLRPRGAILLCGDPGEGPIQEALLGRGIGIYTSRCGSFPEALQMLDAQPVLALAMERKLITHTLALSHLADAFQLAAGSRDAIKVVVETVADR